MGEGGADGLSVRHEMHSPKLMSMMNHTIMNQTVQATQVDSQTFGHHVNRQGFKQPGFMKNTGTTEVHLASWDTHKQAVHQSFGFINDEPLLRGQNSSSGQGSFGPVNSVEGLHGKKINLQHPDAMKES